MVASRLSEEDGRGRSEECMVVLEVCGKSARSEISLKNRFRIFRDDFYF